MPTFLSQQLRQLAQLASTAAAASLAACSAVTPTEDPDAGTPTEDQDAGSSGEPRNGNPRYGTIPSSAGWTPACHSSFLSADSPNFARTVDYLANYFYEYAPGSENGRRVLVDESGTPCGAATNMDVCLITLNSQVTYLPSSRFTLFNAQDNVERVIDAADLLPWLGKIDVPSEALLVALQSGMYPNPSSSCSPETPNLSYGLFTREAAGGGYQVRSVYDRCQSGFWLEELTVEAGGSASMLERTRLGDSTCIVGRRPCGLLQLTAAGSSDELGRFFAECSQLEAASVHAFRRMLHELTWLGAPAALRAAAAQSANDEVRHTHMTARLARRYGATGQAPRLAHVARRSAFQIALENAVEGCVRETYGAALAHTQALSAHDREVADCMRSIAADETRHAQLSWSLAGWLEPRLPVHERELLTAARAAALEQLAREISDDPLSARARTQAGLPSVSGQLSLLNRMAGALHLS